MEAEKTQQGFGGKKTLNLYRPSLGRQHKVCPRAPASGDSMIPQVHLPLISKAWGSRPQGPQGTLFSLAWWESWEYAVWRIWCSPWNGACLGKLSSTEACNWSLWEHSHLWSNNGKLSCCFRENFGEFHYKALREHPAPTSAPWENKEDIEPWKGLPRRPSGKESTCRCRRRKRCGFSPWVGKIPWRRKWQPTPVFLPEESHGERSLVGYRPWGHKGSDTTERVSTFLKWSNRTS